MTPWSLVALAAILCTTAAVCWGLWLNAIYQPDPELPLELVAGGPEASEEQPTREWPAPH